MWYNSHKDRVLVSECLTLWYWFTRVVLDKGPLNGLSLYLNNGIFESNSYTYATISLVIVGQQQVPGSFHTSSHRSSK